MLPRAAQVGARERVRGAGLRDPVEHGVAVRLVRQRHAAGAADLPGAVPAGRRDRARVALQPARGRGGGPAHLRRRGLRAGAARPPGLLRPQPEAGAAELGAARGQAAVRPHLLHRGGVLDHLQQGGVRGDAEEVQGRGPAVRLPEAAGRHGHRGGQEEARPRHPRDHMG